jgi:hypothetical protein
VGTRDLQADRVTGAYVRLLGAFGALAAAAAAVVIAALLVRGLPAVSSEQAASIPAAGAATPASSTQVTTRAASAFPAPPRGAVVFGREAGLDVLGLAVVPKQGKILLQASLVTYAPKAPRLAVSFRVKGANGTQIAHATACGRGCYRASAAVAKPEWVQVVLRPHSPAQVSFAMPAAWPPPSGAAIVKRADRVWRSLNTLVIRDKLGDGRVTLDTLWKIVAPDRIAYRVMTGEESIIIGDRRWTRPAGSKRWLASPQQPVQQPLPFWTSAVDARVLGTVSVRGRPAWKVSFFDPGTPGWFTILVDKGTMHTMEMWMTATAHFMHDSYGPFNGPLSIVPPG